MMRALKLEHKYPQSSRLKTIKRDSVK